MPLIGWVLGTQLADSLRRLNDSVSILLALIGGKMLFDAFRGDDEGEAGEPKDKEARL